MTQHLWLACLALALLPSGCAGDERGKPCPGCKDGGAADCQPGFDLTKSAFGCHTLCQAGQVCEDMKRCVPLGCSRAKACTERPEPYGLHHTYTGTGLPNTKPYTVSGTIKRAGPGSHGYEVTTATETLSIWAYLPADMQLPVTDGETVTVRLCYHGNPINNNHNVVLRDATGVLIAAGGRGIDAVPPDCAAPELTVAREELGCAPYRGDLKYEIEDQPHANFALKFSAGGASITLPMRGRGKLTLQGRAYRVANFRSYHPIEAQVTDIGGALEGFAVVRQ